MVVKIKISILLLLVHIVLAGCVSGRAVKKSDSRLALLELADTTVIIPSDGTPALQLDSSFILYIESRLKLPSDTFQVNSDKGRSQMRFYRDSNGNLTVDCMANLAEVWLKILRQQNMQLSDYNRQPVVGSDGWLFRFWWLPLMSSVFFFLVVLFLFNKHGKKSN